MVCMGAKGVHVKFPLYIASKIIVRKNEINESVHYVVMAFMAQNVSQQKFVYITILKIIRHHSNILKIKFYSKHYIIIIILIKMIHVCHCCKKSSRNLVLGFYEETLQIPDFPVLSYRNFCIQVVPEIHEE